jgi:hypothetical protein
LGLEGLKGASGKVVLTTQILEVARKTQPQHPSRRLAPQGRREDFVPALVIKNWRWNLAI